MTTGTKTGADTGGGGGGSPGGSDTQMQYNNGGSFGGASGFTWDDSNNNAQLSSSTRLILQQATANYTLAWNDPSAARTITLPDPGADANFLLTEGTQTINGDRDYDGMVTRVVNSITGDGTATTISNSDHFVPVDSSSSSETINLPSSPTVGEEHIIRRDGSNSVTIDGNGNNIQEGTSASSTFTLDTDGQRVRLIWDGTNWKGAD